MKYKQLVKKQVSAEEERKMELRIQQKLGGIDALLQKAVRLHPSMFSDAEELMTAAETTKQKVGALLEETKRVDKFELGGIYLKTLKKSSTDSTKQILKKTKDEVKSMSRKLEAAKTTALKALKLKLKAKSSSSQFISDKTFAVFNQTAQ